MSFPEHQSIRRRQIVVQARENDEKLFWGATAKPLPTEKEKRLLMEMAGAALLGKCFASVSSL